MIPSANSRARMENGSLGFESWDVRVFRAAFGQRLYCVPCCKTGTAVTRWGIPRSYCTDERPFGYGL
jgi:hypothetical protein